MGYYTSYSLSFIGGESHLDIIKELRDECDDAEYAITDDGDCNETCKWYEHEEDMVKFSRKWPAVVFALSGESEDGYLWIKYFRDGGMQETQAVITFDEFDESKLK